MSGRMRVVVVEDSPTQARAIAQMLEADGDIAVIATAAGAIEAAAMVRELRPDVVTMDLDIPDGGGHGAIRTIMSDAPTPILVISGTYGERSAPAAVEALAAGAVEAMPKPRTWTEADAQDLRRLVRLVRGVPVIGRRRSRRPEATGPAARTAAPHTSAVVGVAASTGGPAALAALIQGLTGVAAPVLVVQHIHQSFAAGFAAWLQSASGRPAELARDGAKLRDGIVYVAPADQHLLLGRQRTIRLADEPASLHRPSADVLFTSMAREAGPDGIGVVLTGMGSDGARGLAELRAAGGRVFAQDRPSSVVFGMPQAAVRAGAVDTCTPLEDLPAAIRAAVETLA